MPIQDIKVWSSTLITDDLEGNVQRRPIDEEEWLEGWGRRFGVSNQQMNQLLYLLTSYSAPVNTSPYLVSSGITLSETSLLMDGRQISSDSHPFLFEVYGNNLPDLRSEAPAGFVYVVRAQ